MIWLSLYLLLFMFGSFFPHLSLLIAGTILGEPYLTSGQFSHSLVYCVDTIDGISRIESNEENFESDSRAISSTLSKRERVRAMEICEDLS